MAEVVFNPSSGTGNQEVSVSGECNPGLDETTQYQVQTEDGSITKFIEVTHEGKREEFMVSDGENGYEEFIPFDGESFNVVKEAFAENSDC